MISLRVCDGGLKQASLIRTIVSAALLPPNGTFAVSAS